MDIASFSIALAQEFKDVPIVITGGSGFLGLSLVKLLLEAKADSVFVLDRRIPKPEIQKYLDWNSIRFLQVDLTDRAAMRALTVELPPRFVLVHAASLISTQLELDQSAVQEIDVAAQMVLNLIESLGPALASVTFISSVEVFGTPTNLLVTDEHALILDSIYGVGKLVSEDLLQSGARELGFPLAILRVSHIYGPLEHMFSETHEVRSRRAIPNFLRRILSGQTITLVGEGEDMRDYVHAYDVAQAVWKTILTKANGSYIVAAGQSRPMIEVVRAAAEACGKTVEIQFQPRKAERKDYVFSIEKAKRELGYIPTVDFVSGLKDEAYWMERVGLDV
jgi:UDP-glucose 4-epimerase